TRLATPASSPPPSTAFLSWTRSPSDFFARSRRTQPSRQLPVGRQRHSLAGSSQIARSRELHRAPAPPDSCERCPSEKLPRAASYILPPRGRPNGVERPSSPRRSSRSRSDAAPAPIAIRRRIVPFAPFNLCSHGHTPMGTTYAGLIEA